MKSISLLLLLSFSAFAAKDKKLELVKNKNLKSLEQKDLEAKIKLSQEEKKEIKELYSENDSMVEDIF